MGPGIGGVLGHIDRHIAEDLDAESVHIRTEILPLLIELELCVLVEFDVIIELTMVVFHGIVPVPADVLRPIWPLFLIEKALQRHEKRIVIQPPAILADEALVVGIIGDPAAFIGLAQQRKAVGVHLVVIHMLGVMTKVHGFDFLRIGDAVELIDEGVDLGF